MTLDEKLASMPDRPGVYLYRDAKAQVIYVGKAASLRGRVRSYFQESRPRDAKTDALVRQIADLEYIVTDNELEALMLEANLVRKHRPRYNIILRDDKHYPFLKLTTNEPFPRLLVARRVQSDGALYFGPFYPATAMRETLRLTRQLFPLRTCSIEIDGTLPRPCIQYAIHRCNAPCTGWETREGYAKTARDVQRFLEGKNDDLALTLTRQMEKAAAEQKFERAAVLRDQIQSLNKVRERQKIISTEEVDQDVLGVVRQGNDACVELFFVRRGTAGRSGGVLLRQGRRLERRRDPLGLRAAVLRQAGDAGARGAGVRGDPGVPTDRRVAERDRQAPRADPGPAARRQARVRGHGRGQRRHRAAEPPALARQPPAARPGRAHARAEPAGPAQPHRGLRHLQHPGHRAGGLDGRVGERRHEEGRLQALQDPHGQRRRRLRVAARGPGPALRPRPRARERAARPRIDRRRPRSAECRTSSASGARAGLHPGGRPGKTTRRSLRRRQPRAFDARSYI